jgi:ATP-dependent Zn protease
MNMTAIHEAGHALVSFDLDIDIRSVDILESEEALGNCYHDEVIDFDLDDMTIEQKDFVERRIKVMMAGYIAEKIFSEDTEYIQSEDDYHKAVAFAECINTPPRQLQAYIDYLYICVEEFLTLWKKILSILAESLDRKKSLSGEEVREIIIKAFNSQCSLLRTEAPEK